MTEQLKRYNLQTQFDSDCIIVKLIEDKDGELIKASDISRIKADVVYEAIGIIREEYGTCIYVKELYEYADKLERGEV